MTSRFPGLVFLISFLPACFSVGSLTQGIDDGAQSYDKAQAGSSFEQQRKMDDFMAKMQTAMSAYMQKGKEESKAQMGEAITALTVASAGIKGSVETAVQNAMAKAIATNPALRSQLTGMASTDPASLQNLAEGFIETARQRAGGGNQITQGDALLRSEAAATYADAHRPSGASYAGSPVPVGRGYAITATRPDILVPVGNPPR